jgi:hypothetical protein
VPVEQTVYVPKVVERERVVAGARPPLDLDVMAGGGVIGFIDSGAEPGPGRHPPRAPDAASRVPSRRGASAGQRPTSSRR